MKIQIVNEGLKDKIKKGELHIKPQSLLAGAFDLLSCSYEDVITLDPKESIVIKTGIKMEIPQFWIGLLNTRSGNGFKYNVRLSNCIGYIDADFRGEVQVALFNDSKEEFVINKYDRIAQLAVVPHYNYSLIEIVDDLSETARGSNGFGSTGVA